MFTPRSEGENKNSSAGVEKALLKIIVLIAAHLGWFHRQVVRERHTDLARGFLIAQSTGVDRSCEHPMQRVKSHQLLKKPTKVISNKLAS